MIPAEGRDVQCSNCTTTWFQPGVAARAQAADETAEAEPPQPPTGDFSHPEADDDFPSVEDEMAEDLAEAEEIASEGLDDPADNWDDDGAPGAEEVLPQMSRPELAPETRDVLREEAQREAELRRHEAEVSLQRQGEMALDQIPDEAPATDLDATISDLVSKSNAAAEEVAQEIAAEEAALAERVAETVSESQDLTAQVAAAGAAAAGNSRRDLLPDIEEINSTLRANEDRSPGEALSSDIDTIETRPRRRRGLRLGFGLVMLVFAGLILAYTNAPRITQAFPSLLPMMQSYVAQVDRFRLWVDDIAQSALPNDTPADTAATPPAAASVPETESASEPETGSQAETNPAADASDTAASQDAPAPAESTDGEGAEQEAPEDDAAPVPVSEDQEEAQN